MHVHTHTLRKKLPNAKPLQVHRALALGSSASHKTIKNNEGDIVMWLGAFLQGTVMEVAKAEYSDRAVQNA